MDPEKLQGMTPRDLEMMGIKPLEAARLTLDPAIAAGIQQADKTEADSQPTEVSGQQESRPEAVAPRIENLKYIQIDDNFGALEAAGEALEGLGMAGRLGEARSLDGAFALLQQLSQSGEALDLILLDQDFLESDEDAMTDKRAGEKFLEKFQEILQEPRYQQVLKNTKIIMATSHASEVEAMQRFHQKSERVIGGAVQKGSSGQEIAGVLGLAGVVEKDERVIDACRQVALRDLEATLRSEIGGIEDRSILQRQTPAGDRARSDLLQWVNEARTKMNVTPLEIDNPEISAITAAVAEGNTYDNLVLPRS